MQKSIFKSIEHKEVSNKKHNFVIVWFWDLWKWWHQLLTEAWQNVCVCSLNGRQYHDEYSLTHWVKSYNVYKLPIPYEEIDVVLICCTATDIDLLWQCLPKRLIKEKSNQFVFFQNGIGIRERIKNALWNEHPTQVIPYFSFKANNWSKVNIKFAKPSPATGNILTLNTLIDGLNRGPEQDPIFEGMDSIILRKEERKKWYVNSFLNTISVIYNAPVWKAVESFTKEFWKDAKNDLYKELLTYNNDIAGDELAHMEIEEIQEDIENAIEKFNDEYPSTYFQYYKNSKDRQEIHSDEQDFIGRIIAWCTYQNKKLLLLEKLYHRMQSIKKDINSKI